MSASGRMWKISKILGGTEISVRCIASNSEPWDVYGDGLWLAEGRTLREALVKGEHAARRLAFRKNKEDLENE